VVISQDGVVGVWQWIRRMGSGRLGLWFFVFWRNLGLWVTGLLPASLSPLFVVFFSHFVRREGLAGGIPADGMWNIFVCL
jgi:hypothetical protein